MTRNNDSILEAYYSLRHALRIMTRMCGDDKICTDCKMNNLCRCIESTPDDALCTLASMMDMEDE